MTTPPHPQRTLFVGLGLALLVLLVFGQAVTFGFVDYDDNVYVFRNRHVIEGLSPSSIGWALTDTSNSLWLPTVRLSYLIEASVAGMNPVVFHLTNILLHLANTLLLWRVLVMFTGGFWRSAAVAALFAVHPLRVESVVWVTERKDVLCLAGALLSMLWYGRYVRGGGLKAYLASLGFFLFALAAKPMAITLPVLLLMLDWWPLGRYTSRQAGNSPKNTKTASLRTASAAWPVRIREKLPYLILAAIVAIITIHANSGRLTIGDVIPLALRIPNAIISWARYLGMLVIPTNLAFYYPFDVSTLTPATIAGSAALLAVITGIAIWQAKQRPWLLVGWGWYSVALLPVIGIIQAGDQAFADRFTYLPLTGILIAVVWTAGEAVERFRIPRAFVAAGVVAILGIWSMLSIVQARTWQSSETLFTHALAVTHDNDLAHLNYANVLLSAGQPDKAQPHYEAALAINPRNSGAHVNLGGILLRRGDFAGAVEHLLAALADMPNNPYLHRDLAIALDRLGRREEAMAHMQEAARLGLRP